MPRWSDVISLISETYTENDIGDFIPVETYTEVFASKKSIRQSEFYQAQAAGLKPSIAFDVRSVEYNDEKLLEYDGKKYGIMRAYDRSEFIELICEGVVNDGTT